MLQADAAGGVYSRHRSWRRSGAADRLCNRHVHAESLELCAGFALLGPPQDLRGGLNRLKLLGGFLVARLAVRVNFLGETAISGLDGGEVGIRIELEHVE